jgi:hypothetical protein
MHNDDALEVRKLRRLLPYSRGVEVKNNFFQHVFLSLVCQLILIADDRHFSYQNQDQYSLYIYRTRSPGSSNAIATSIGVLPSGNNLNALASGDFQNLIHSYKETYTKKETGRCNPRR